MPVPIFNTPALSTTRTRLEALFTALRFRLLPKVRVPADVPGERMPPSATVVAPPMVPLPPRVPLEFTVTPLVPLRESVTSRVHALTVVGYHSSPVKAWCSSDFFNASCVA